jgi:hypothetical protein
MQRNDAGGPVNLNCDRNCAAARIAGQRCRLDTGQLAEFCALLERSAATDVDLLILNKFGKAEAEGRGLRRNLELALESGIAVLTALRPPYDKEWQRLHGGLAAALPSDMETVHRWCLTAVGHGRNADGTHRGTDGIPVVHD